uniref:Uncharacterized protein n=1 Tax=Arundo donax TaxID=35708 RepID=A0A0A9AI99_ARUDO
MPKKENLKQYLSSSSKTHCLIEWTLSSWFNFRWHKVSRDWKTTQLIRFGANR